MIVSVRRVVCCVALWFTAEVCFEKSVYTSYRNETTCRLFGLGKTISETLSSKGKFTQFVSNHLFSDMNRQVVLAIVHEKLEANKRR